MGRVPLSVSRAVVSIDGVRSASSQMSADGVRTEWKFVKGINDYDKEQTYMYLGKAEGKAKFADPVANSLLWPLRKQLARSAAKGLCPSLMHRHTCWLSLRRLCCVPCTPSPIKRPGGQSPREYLMPSGPCCCYTAASHAQWFA